MKIMVLNDGETYTDLSGCMIVEVPDGAEPEDIEDHLTHLRKYGQDESVLEIFDNLQANIAEVVIIHTYYAEADTPPGFNYGTGYGDNDPINCKHCGQPLSYIRMGDWVHTGPPLYEDCHVEDLGKDNPLREVKVPPGVYKI